MIRIILFISLALPSSVIAAETESNLLNFIPAIITASHTPSSSLQLKNPLTVIGGVLSACKDGLITDGWSMYELINSHSQSITIVEMKIIDLSWQFAEPNLLPVTLAPGATTTYSINHTSGYLCENPPESTKIVMFVFSDGNFQKI